MKIAIPVFESRVSPRFDCAPGFRVCELDGDGVARITEISCDGWSDSERVSKLKGFGVDTLICGGLPGFLKSVLTNSGIKVIPWVMGDVDDVLSLFLRGRLDSGMAICPGRGKRRHCKRGIKGDLNRHEKRR